MADFEVVVNDQFFFFKYFLFEPFLNKNIILSLQEFAF